METEKGVVNMHLFPRDKIHKESHPSVPDTIRYITAFKAYTSTQRPISTFQITIYCIDQLFMIPIADLANFYYL